MKVHKPLQLSLLTKSFSWKKQHHLAVTVLLGFPFDTAQDVLLEQDLWQGLPEWLGDYPILDSAMPKPQGELLVYGNYYAPGGYPVNADRIQVSIGTIDKTLAVIGQRYWNSLQLPTEPESFTEMPVIYRQAFGGTDFSLNPDGKGIDKIEVNGETRHPLPRIEYPDDLVTSTSSRPEPAGLSALDMMWEPRFSKMGSYDEQWKQHDFPGLAQDLDWTHFNCAPSDQWIDGFWRGDEAFRVVNMHASESELKGQLPGFRVRCFVDQNQHGQSLFSELAMHAETVFLFPNEKTGVLLYRGTVQTAEDDATDISQLLLAYEDLSEAIRSREYYELALRNRLDKKQTFKFAMYTRDIIPASERCGFVRLLDDGVEQGESELARNLQQRAQQEKQKALELIEQQKQKFILNLQQKNIDPAPFLKQFEAKNDQPDDPMIKEIMQTMEQILPGCTGADSKAIKIEQVDFTKFETLSRQMEALKEAKIQQQKDKLLEISQQAEGSKYAEVVHKQVAAAISKMDQPPALPRPPVTQLQQAFDEQFSKFEQIKAKMRQQNLTLQQKADLQTDIGAKLEKLKIDLDKKLSEVSALYRTGAHYIEGRPPHKEPMDIIQYRFHKDLAKGKTMAGRDLSGVDFSDLDLSGIDFSDCYLEYSNFTNANLRGANLSRTVLTHANLTHADFTDAKLINSNIGDSQLKGAIFKNVIFGEAVLSKSLLNGTKFSGCSFTALNLLEADLREVDMQGCKLEGANFVDIDLSSGRFIECELSECNFVNCKLERCDFCGSNLSATNFITCNLDNSIFIRANMRNVRFPSECSLKQCDFSDATLDMASLRDVDGEGSCFERSSFHMADFSGANLQKAKFYGAAGKRALFMKTDLAYADFSSVNLMEGSLMKARLTGADLSNSNLYSVEFQGVTVGDTNFSGANLDMTALENWRPSR